MKNYYLELIPENVESSIKVKMYLASPDFKLGEAYKNKIYSDRVYTARINLSNDKKVSNVDVYINGFKVDSTYNNSKIYFKNYKNGRIFIDNFGFLQISIEVTYINDEVELLYSEYLNVMIKNGVDSNALRNIANYIYRYQERLLFDSDMISNDIADVKKSNNQSLESQIEILKRIVFEYKNCFRYFKNNAKFKLQSTQVVDDFEKMKYLNSSTIDYIVQHPEQLIKSSTNTDIVINKQSYIPKKVVANDNTKNFDIYENNNIVNFLFTLVNSIDKMLEKARAKLSDYNISEIENDYFVSASIIYGVTKKKVERYIETLCEIKSDIVGLYKAYYKLMPCTSSSIMRIPKATHTFLSIKFYNRLYNCICSWFEFGIYDLSKENFLVPFLVNSQLYEYYVLLKMYNFIIKQGYSLEIAKKYNYQKAKSTRYNNTFYFKSKEKDLTLYYQPIIDISERKHNNEIAILKNNDITSKKPYIPDYILKITDKRTLSDKYIVFDAKFSTAKNVKQHYYQDLAFKYLFSFTTIDNNSEIIGLCAINGKNSEEAKFQSIYTPRFSKALLPFANILTIAEDGNEEAVEDMVHFELLERLFSEYIDKYL